MPKTRVKLFANFREFTHTRELEIEGNTVGEVLDSLCNRFAGLEELVFKDGVVRPYINIFINGNNINESGGLEEEVHTGDEIAIFPPVSGG